MVVTMRSILSQLTIPVSVATKLKIKSTVWTTIELGEPIQRVTLNAIFFEESMLFMRASIQRPCYTVIMELVGNVHLIAGNAEDIPDVLSYLRERGIETTGNPDLYVRHYRHFGIDEARELSERAVLHPVSSSRRTFLVAVDSMTAEAQNALLKTFEEPRGNALFIFLHPAPLMLLPTVRSRAQILSLPGAKKQIPTDASKFLAASPTKRLDMLKPLLEKGDDDRRDTSALLSFLAALECALEKHINNLQGREGLRAVYRARRHIGDRGALVKPLLEQIALLVPTL